MEGTLNFSDSTARKDSLTLVLSNWVATLFAYQPEVYYEIDNFWRNLQDDKLDDGLELHTALLEFGLISIEYDNEDQKKFYLRLDPDLFTKSKGKAWAVVVKENGTELEFSCFVTKDKSPVKTLH